VTFGKDAAVTNENRYWSARNIVESGMRSPLKVEDENEILGILESDLQRTIKGQMVADVPVGAFLSGGVDSSLIVALMQKESSRPVRTFTVGFHEDAYNEAQHAKAVADHLGTDHVEIYLTPGETLATVHRLPIIFDEPFADSSQIPTMLIAAIARRDVKVCLSGDGGDELFGGYTRYHFGLATWKRLSLIPWFMRQSAERLVTATSDGFWNRAARIVKPLLPPRLHAPKFEPMLRQLSSMMTAHTLDELYLRQMSYWLLPGDVALGAEEPASTISEFFSWDGLRDPTARMMGIDLTGYLPDDILVKVDRATMAVSLEARPPFLDHRIVELAWKIPMSLKVNNGQGKLILKQLLARYIPPCLTDRPKMGFGIPIDEWLRGPLRGWAEDLISVDQLNHDKFFAPDAIRLAWEQHLSGSYDHSYALWNVLMFQAWLHR
jgi:asparagine synthase (glutamine-hydrolysing)